MGTQIEEEIPELPIPPYKNVDSGATFVTKAEAFRQALKDTFQPAMNYVIGKINIISNEVSTNATNAETAANIATAAANYKGNWIAGYNTTGYSVGMSVTFTDGFNYISKINNNLVSPVSKTNTTEWGWVEKYENLNGYDEKTTPIDADLLPLSDSTTTFSLKKLTWANIKNTIINSFYSMMGSLSSKTTVGALDEFVINDSGASTKKVTYQNLINTIATSFGGMINNLASKTTPVDADIFPIGDSTESNASKKLTWADIKGNLNTGFKNKIINGNKQVNQSGLTTTDNAYNYDNHYKVGNNWFKFIEGKNIVSGEPYTLSWDGIATAGYYIGTAGALTINAQTFTPIANGETITPTITSSQILWIKFASDSAGSTYNNVQFEPGTVPTPYEQRLYELEKILTQSCYSGTAIYFSNNITSGNAYGGVTSLPVDMRINPILTLINQVNTNGTFNTIILNNAVDQSPRVINFYAVATSTTNGAVYKAGVIADARPY